MCFFFVQDKTTEPASLLGSAEMALLAVKCLHRLVVLGVAEPDTHAEVKMLFPSMLEATQGLLKMRHSLPPTSVLLRPVSKHIRVITKTLLETQQTRPIQFRVYLVPSLRFFWEVLCKLGFDQKDEPVFERFTVQSLQFMSRVIGCKQYGKSGAEGFSAQFSTAR